MIIFRIIILMIYASSCYSEATLLTTNIEGKHSELFESAGYISPELEQVYIKTLSRYHKVKRARLVRVNFELLDKLKFDTSNPTKINLNLFGDSNIPLFLHNRFSSQNTIYIIGSLSKKLDSRYFIQLRISNANQTPRHLTVSFFDHLTGLERIRINPIAKTGFHYIANVESKYANTNTPLAQTIHVPDNSFDAGISTFIDHSIIDIDFISESIGYAIGTASVVYKTIDGGIQWQKYRNNIQGYQEAIHFVSEQEGIVGLHDVTGCPDKCQHRTTASITSDGGESWVKIQYPNLRGIISEIISGGPGIIFASLDRFEPKTSQKILKSVDNGKSWEIIYNDAKTRLSSIPFKWNDNILYLVTRYSSILKIDSEGREIDETPFIGTGYIADLAILSPKNYLVLFSNGSSQRLIKTIDGGITWTNVFKSNTHNFKLIMAKTIDEFALIRVFEQDIGPSDLINPTTDVISFTTNGGISWSESEKIRDLIWSIKPNPRQIFDTQSLVLSGDRILHLYH